MVIILGLDLCKDNCKAINTIFNFIKSGSRYNVGSNNKISNIDLVI